VGKPPSSAHRFIVIESKSSWTVIGHVPFHLHLSRQNFSEAAAPVSSFFKIKCCHQMDDLLSQVEFTACRILSTGTNAAGSIPQLAQKRFDSWILHCHLDGEWICLVFW